MNRTITELKWPAHLLDPSVCRLTKPRELGQTMIIDKGLGLNAYSDLLETAANHIDMIKIGFGTAPLYPTNLLMQKIELAKENGILIYPGGTFLELAVIQNVADEFIETITSFGFTGLEVSDGTIEMDRDTRSRLIKRGIDQGLQVNTEYGKKCWGSSIEIETLLRTIEEDLEAGASLVTIEARESGTGVGIFDGNGQCKEEDLKQILSRLTNSDSLLWEAPLKDQQVKLLMELGSTVNLGNIPPQEIISLEAMRRGLRSDTLMMMQKRGNKE
ncbi:phosphosulfolactate synthase [Paenibacillus albiflavus]|uniref:Phosphosulfolactate synthase n=1 Tax=Paenibacillus albiflavus TaxID=2545760 RepID=A0A4R4EBY9_9BACL|nr:phosphosulfolactate synthase [Paenibacillus albiflavus]TCZ77444.1 phosphosulfolactate synthase [Paenibacillus albiflavus]